MKLIFKMDYGLKSIICLSLIFGVTAATAQEQTSEEEEVQWQAQNKTQIYMSVDIVNKYIWRGLDYGGVNVQPSISIVKKGFSLTAYGSAGFDGGDTKTLGITLGYQWKGLKAMLTDF
jgi:hypothetical protein